MKKCYLSGPITGTEDYLERFSAAVHEVAEMGMIPVNPVTLPHDHDKTWESYVKESLKSLLDCECIYMLKGYYQSVGASLEILIAQRLYYKIFYQS